MKTAASMDKIATPGAVTLDLNGWLNKIADIFSDESQSAFEAACKYVDDHLYWNIFLLGGMGSPADEALVAALDRAGQKWQVLQYSDQYPSLACLYELEKTLKLPGAKSGEVCLRYKLEPSPFFHIEDARIAFWNHLFARRYKGRFIIWIQDSDPNNKDHLCLEGQLRVIKSLGITFHNVYYTSEYFHQMKEMAESLLLQGKAYVDDSPKEILVQQCRDGIESKCRNHTLEENMHLWKEMVAGSDIGRQCRLRGKLDMHYQHRCDQDPVYYSCKPDTPHHLAGRMYNVYPSCLFASSFVDSELNVTHILQSSENSGRTNAVYHRLRQDMGMPSVQSYDYEPMHMEYTLRTAKEHRYFVENQKVNGWLDLRLPTVPSLRRRGVSSQALKQFFLEQGLKKKQDLVEWESLWSINSQMIFTKPASFHTVLHRNKYVVIILENSPKTHKTILVHVEATSLIEGKTLTLAYSNDVIVKSILKDKDGNFIQVRGVITEECTNTLMPNLWLSTDDPITSLWLVEIDHLITKKKKKVQPGEDLNSVVNPSTKKITTAYGGPKMRIVQRGEIVRLARMGYYICDEPFVNPIRPVVLIFIPGPDPEHPMFQVSNDDPWNSTGKTKEGKAPTSK